MGTDKHVGLCALLLLKSFIMGWEISLSGGGKGKLQHIQHIYPPQRERGETKGKERCMEGGAGAGREAGEREPETDLLIVH